MPRTLPAQFPESSLPESLPEIESLPDVDAALKAHADIQRTVDKKTAAHNAKVSRIKTALDKDLAPLIAQQKALEIQSADYLKTNRRYLVRNHGKIIALAHGTIAFKIIPDAIKVPRNVSAAIEYLSKRRNGKKFLNGPFYTLNADAIVASDRRVRKELAPFGIGIKRRENLTFKPAGYAKPITLHERPLTPNEIAVSRRPMRKKKPTD